MRQITLLVLAVLSSMCANYAQIADDSITKGMGKPQKVYDMPQKVYDMLIGQTQAEAYTDAFVQGYSFESVIGVGCEEYEDGSASTVYTIVRLSFRNNVLRVQLRDEIVEDNDAYEMLDYVLPFSIQHKGDIVLDVPLSAYSLFKLKIVDDSLMGLVRDSYGRVEQIAFSKLSNSPFISPFPIMIDSNMQPSTVIGLYSQLYSEDPYYIINKQYVVYEQGDKRQVFRPDMDSFVVWGAAHYMASPFAMDKDAIYFKGQRMPIDTAGFQFLGERWRPDAYAFDYIWRTNKQVYINNKKMEVADIHSFHPLSEALKGSYFADDSCIYYYDKKIAGSDGSSAKQVDMLGANEACDHKQTYVNGEAVQYEGEPIQCLNSQFVKTKSYVLGHGYDGFYKFSTADVATFRTLSRRHYSMDKNHVYYDTLILPIAASQRPHIRVWDQVNSAYLSDGQHIYFRNETLQAPFDVPSFGMLPHSDLVFDKDGIFERRWSDSLQTYVFRPFGFAYHKPVKLSNTFVSYCNRYLVYDRQAIDLVDNSYYRALTAQQIKDMQTKRLRPQGQGRLGVLDRWYSYHIYSMNDTVFCNRRAMPVDAKSFEPINGNIYKDKDKVYAIDDECDCKIVEGVEAKSVQRLHIFYYDADNVYYGLERLMSSPGIELLAVFSGYRKGCSLDTTPQSNYYLFKNNNGYWVLCASATNTMRYLGKQLGAEWQQLDL